MDLFTGPGSIYRPLRGSEIRLVKLKRTRRPDQPIELELFYAPLDTAKFLALSYQWGKPGETKTISVNGTEFPVFESLFRALESLYLHKISDILGADVFEDPVPAEAQAQARQDATDTDTDEGLMGWWIDAICINQASLTERSEQVPRMGKIYSTAARVVIWPGDSYAFKSDHLNAAIADATKKYSRIRLELRPQVQASANDAAAVRDLLIQGATDRRDRIFGILGMANLPTPAPPDIQPDYTRSFEDVAFSYAKFLVLNHGRLDVLAMGVNSHPGYPSWVPDFDPPSGPRLKPGEVQSVSSLSADGRCLVARGSLIGTVLAVVPAAFDTLLPDYEGIVRPSANLRSVAPELVVREWLDQPRAEGNIDDDGCTAVACLGLTEAAGHACSGALYDALQCLRTYFMAIRCLLLDDGHVLQGPQYQCQDPEPGDVVSAIRGMDELAVLRRLGVGREPEGFQIIDARCRGTAFPAGPVTEDVFTNRAERDFHIW
ncbi:hypothetical protein GGTG_12060 [Gaeumannomyces tritici R3-111a-1]|uniref:Heterokaryon incompatibility domain-containing protein n=1 Tax=Gaeumannomyces tritici (strain R3-111a-1) TaxID=644352 RepID=J3PEY1_GAET3|nr:hypothetical protein GGTG_12060 [Gaeumannomyces tritici R3-111a-1]EJT71039.1 hypothetical protein GGTG_12060 [Gaeumannomyces tritici R3-111a-1]